MASMTPEQMREARELLGWSRDRLGAMSGTNAHFIRNYEEFGRAMAPRRGNADRLSDVRAAVELAGVAFTEQNDGEPRVRLREHRT